MLNLDTFPIVFPADDDGLRHKLNELLAGEPAEFYRHPGGYWDRLNDAVARGTSLVVRGIEYSCIVTEDHDGEDDSFNFVITGLYRVDILP